MANEITISLNVSVENGSYKDTFSPGRLQVDQSAVGRGGHVQQIGTSAELVDVGDVSSEGYCILRNLDATNYITYGPLPAGSGASMEAFGKLKAGEVAFLRIKPGVTIYAQADTAACLVDVRVYED